MFCIEIWQKTYFLFKLVRIFSIIFDNEATTEIKKILVKQKVQQSLGKSKKKVSYGSRIRLQYSEMHNNNNKKSTNLCSSCATHRILNSARLEEELWKHARTIAIYFCVVETLPFIWIFFVSVVWLLYIYIYIYIYITLHNAKEKNRLQEA